MERKLGENNFEYKLRLCLSKLNKEIDLDWCEIASLIGEDVSADHLRKLSYGYKEYYDYINSTNGVATRILSISDTHVPYQLPITTFKEYVGIVDVLQLNGDILDCQSISKFSKSYRVSMIEEMVQGRQYIIDLIEYIKPKQVFINYGNHEMRYQAYLSKNLDDDMLQLMPQTALDLICTDGFYHYDKRNKTKTWYEPICKAVTSCDVVYTEDWKCKIGNTWFVHPSAFSTGMMKTAEKAMQYMITQDRSNWDCLVMAHTHQLGQYPKGNIMLYEQGACCKTSEMNYTDGKLYNPQQQGFIYICQDIDGNLIKDKTKLINLN